MKSRYDLSTFDRIPVLIETNDYPAIEAVIVRHLAPRTADSIIAALPMESRAYLWQTNLVYFDAGLNSGPEKAQKYFKRGNLLYWPLKASICIAVADGIPYSQVNLIGAVEKLPDGLNLLKPGTKIRIGRN